ncbi:MAG TPA: hypothetical protein DEO92_02730, partial [Phycisphaerales bacterium]|nr:hypothetical protein [Phycisphaerales bacterium]
QISVIFVCGAKLKPRYQTPNSRLVPDERKNELLMRKGAHCRFSRSIPHQRVSFDSMNSSNTVHVIKCGGSVLGTKADIAAMAIHLASIAVADEQLIVVVSAPAGVTDALFQSVSLEASTSSDEIAEHVSSGERIMVTRLTDQLQAMGVNAAALTVHDIGLRASGPPLDADPISLDVAAILQRLDEHPVLVVPGFAGVGSSGARRLLGRGGSDLSAVFIAAELGASCTLLQNATGVYEHDPSLHDAAPPRFDQMHWDDLLELDNEVVQAKAVRLAKQRQLPFRVTSLDAQPGTLVGDVQLLLASDRPRHASS